MKNIGSSVVYKIREYFHEQRRQKSLPEQRVEIDIRIVNRSGKIMAFDAGDSSLEPLRLLDTYNSTDYYNEADDKDIHSFLSEIIWEYDDTHGGLSKEEKYSHMLSILVRRLRSLDVE